MQEFEQELCEELWRQNESDKVGGLVMLGLGHFNYNSLIRHRQIVEQRVLEKQEKTMAQIEKVIQELTIISEDSIKLAEFSRELVQNKPQLAEKLQFIISVEIEDKHRRDNNADQI